VDASSAGDVRAVTREAVSAAAAAVLSSTPAFAVLGNTMGAPTLSTVSKWLK
jgi:hypothetical protein